MLIFREFKKFPSNLRNGVYAIGNFDGLHYGHKAVINEAKNISSNKDLRLGVITFDPHPRQFFNPKEPSFRLTPSFHKLQILESWGLNLVLDIEFNKEIAETNAEDFVLKHLLEDLGASHIVVGHDFAFGSERKGDTQMLRKLEKKYNFNLTIVEAQVSSSGGLFSSRAIRELLQSGRPNEAANLLGRWWSIKGRVIKGERRGRELGYPTINLKLPDYLQPSLGIYAVWVRIPDLDTWQKGAASLGIRPTFEGRNIVLEVYLVDFSGDLYGKNVEVAFVEYLRPEEKFLDIDSLKTQMAEDCMNCKIILGQKERRADFFLNKLT